MNLIQKMFKFLLLAVLLFLSFTSSKTDNNNYKDNIQSETVIEKNILVVIFPGARSHNFVIKNLFDYTFKYDIDIENGKEGTNINHYEKTKKPKFKNNYYIVVHNYDSDLWTDPKYQIYGYGEVATYAEKITEAIEEVQVDPVFGYTKFNKAMIFIFDSFIESGYYQKLQNIKFDMLISDIPNFLSKMLYETLQIKNHIYLSPPCLPNLQYKLFELNPSYFPAIGTTNKQLMNFPQRVLNSIYVNGAIFMFHIFSSNQAASANTKFGFNLSNDVFIYDSLVISQCPLGLTYNYGAPPNFVRISAVSPRNANKLNERELDSFLNKYKTNIFVSQGTMWKTLRIEELLKVVNHYPNYGFIINVKTEIKDIVFPVNVQIVKWVPQNDLLGDKRLNLFITHGGINSVMEGLYHKKLMIIFGATIDQLNTAAYVEEFKYGYTITDKALLTPENLVKAIDLMLKPGNIYQESVERYSRLLKGLKDPRVEFKQWLEYGHKFGYSQLVLDIYKTNDLFTIYNYDVLALWMLIIVSVCYIVYRSTKKVLTLIFCSCSSKKKIKKHEKLN